MSELVVLAAYDEAPIVALELDDKPAALSMLQRSHALYANRSSWLPAEQRLAILERVADLVDARAEQLARDAAREGGKPLIDSRVEIQRAAQGVRVAVRELWKLAGQQIPMGLTASSAHRLAYTFHEPRGVVLAISAFNHPFNLIVHQVVPAVATGCPVIVKPARATPISCRHLVDTLYEAGLPEPWCQMLLCDGTVAGELVGDPRVAFLTFIGSAEVGWRLRAKLAPGATCALEHGGLAPVIVDRTADIEASIAPLVKGGFYHAGQVCVSVQRIYVDRERLDGFVGPFVERTKALRVGDPLDPSTEVGPLISPREVDRVHEWVQEAVAGGGTLLCGGTKLSRTCYSPTVVLDPPDDVQLSCAEVFGPVVAIYSYDDRHDAIRRANAPDVFFQASVFTRDLDVALDTTRRLNGMAVMVNDHPAFRVDWMPFGGHRQSGQGLGGIGYTMAEMTLERMMVLKSAVL